MELKIYCAHVEGKNDRIDLHFFAPFASFLTEIQNIKALILPETGLIYFQKFN
jgi:hypothetical protein